MYEELYEELNEELYRAPYALYEESVPLTSCRWLDVWAAESGVTPSHDDIAPGGERPSDHQHDTLLYTM